MKQPTALGVWAPLVTLWIVWGSTYLGLSEVVKSMPPLIATGSRYFVASLCLGIGVLIFRGVAPFRITRRELFSGAIMGLGIISIWAAALALGQRYVPGGIAALIGASIPLWIVLFRLLNGDRPSRLTGAGVMIGIAGIVMMLLPGGIVSVVGLLFLAGEVIRGTSQLFGDRDVADADGRRGVDGRRHLDWRTDRIWQLFKRECHWLGLVGDCLDNRLFGLYLSDCSGAHLVGLNVSICEPGCCGAARLAGFSGAT